MTDYSTKMGEKRVPEHKICLYERQIQQEYIKRQSDINFPYHDPQACLKK